MHLTCIFNVPQYACISPRVSNLGFNKARHQDLCPVSNEHLSYNIFSISIKRTGIDSELFGFIMYSDFPIFFQRRDTVCRKLGNCIFRNKMHFWGKFCMLSS